MIGKIQELFENIWVKLLAAIPACFLELEEREAVMVFAFLVILTIDTIFGAMVAKFVDKDFEWNLLAKKVSKKFLLYFFTMLASFVVSNAYGFISWWFYVMGSIIVFSEFGSLMTKAKKMGLPIDTEITSALNKRINDFIKSLIGVTIRKRK